jgi:hypothetical protein
MNDLYRLHVRGEQVDPKGKLRIPASEKRGRRRFLERGFGTRPSHFKATPLPRAAA